MAFLRFVSDSGQVQTRNLDVEQFIIGRAASSQVAFDDDMVSREHLRIDLEPDGRFRIRDLASRNKTFVNGEVVNETLLFHGDIIRVGDHVVEFLDDSSVPEPIDLDFITPDRTDPPNCEWIKLKAPLTLTTGQIEQMTQLHGDQPLCFRPEDAAQSVLSQLLLDVQAERGLVALRGEGKMEIRPVAQRALRRLSGGSMTPVSQSFLMAPILQFVAGRYPQTASQINPKLGYAATALAAPLLCRGEVIGVVYVDRPGGKKPFPPASLTYVAATGAQLGMVIGESSRRLTRTAAREGVAWLTVLRRMQTSLSVPLSGSDALDVASKFFPGRVRCGDLADVIHLGETRCALTIIDGGGQGIWGLTQAAAFRAAVRASVTVSDDALLDPAPLFNHLNRWLAASPVRQILPCFYAGIDLNAGRLVYVNAGGSPPLLMVAPGRLVTLDQAALVLGVDPDYQYEGTRVELPQSFGLVCHTDGLVEAVNSGGEPLGDERLHDLLLQRESFVSAPELVTRIGQLWTGYLGGVQPDDDALVLTLRHG